MKLQHKVRCLLAALCGLSLAGSHTATAQSVVYSDDFEADHTFNWIVLSGLGDNTADFYFDYSTVGVPVAPHSTGGSTRALKLQANMNPATQAGSVAGYGLSVSPSDFAITENFEMRFDMWLNYVASANGSTLIGGAGFGTAGTVAQRAGYVDSVFIGASTDGGTTADYRVYVPRNVSGMQDNTGVYAAGGRNNTLAYYTTNFPGTIAPPVAQTNLYPTQTPIRTPAGTVGFKWLDVSLKKVANIITYKIDGIVIATVDASTNGTLGGANILFNLYDINGNASTDPLSTNLLFALFDNLRITNFPSVITVSATSPNASETGPTPGGFTVSRSEPGPAVTVFYTMSGTAESGKDYTALPGSVTIKANELSAEIPLNPIDDPISELAETATLTITESSSYVGAGFATVTIADNDIPTIDIATVQGSMYERLADDRVRFRLTRRGNLDAASFNVNLSYSGTAATSRHTKTTGVTFDPGVLETEFDVNPVNDSLLQGDQTIIATVSSGTGYVTGTNSPSATATIVDDELPAETVLFSDNFNTDSSANWTLRYASTNSTDADYIATFAFDYSAFPYFVIPPAPHSGTDTKGLMLQVNKNDAEPIAAALNLYPKNRTFTGNYAVRFDMFLVAPGTSPTEYALFGINHSGNLTNWFRNSTGGVPSGWTFDGLFYSVEADAAANGDYVLFTAPSAETNNPVTLTSRTAASLTGIFKTPPYSKAGAPANTSSTTTPTWADVEISQVGSVVTLKINNTVILTQTNSTAFTSGNIMLGVCDAYDSLGSADGAVIYDNLRVIQLASTSRPAISGIRVVGNTVEISFTGETSDAPAAFGLLEATTVNGTYSPVTATITGSNGTFKAVRPLEATPRFFRLQRL